LAKTADKAEERGLRLLLVSAYRNSKTCPIHGEPLSFPEGPKIGLCPYNHWVHRDIAAVLNMLKRATEKLDSKYAEVVKKVLSAVDEKMLEEWSRYVLEAEGVLQTSRPVVLARASPMTPPGEETVSPTGMRAPMNCPEGNAKGRGGGQFVSSATKYSRAGLPGWGG
ncbi:MAG: hypothetical protein ACP5KY_09940, partial [Thermoproteus sp.]